MSQVLALKVSAFLHDPDLAQLYINWVLLGQELFENLAEYQTSQRELHAYILLRTKLMRQLGELCEQLITDAALKQALTPEQHKDQRFFLANAKLVILRIQHLQVISKIAALRTAVAKQSTFNEVIKLGLVKDIRPDLKALIGDELYSSDLSVFSTTVIYPEQSTQAHPPGIAKEPTPGFRPQFDIVYRPFTVTNHKVMEVPGPTPRFKRMHVLKFVNPVLTLANNPTWRQKVDYDIALAHSLEGVYAKDYRSFQLTSTYAYFFMDTQLKLITKVAVNAARNAVLANALLEDLIYRAMKKRGVAPVLSLAIIPAVSLLAYKYVPQMLGEAVDSALVTQERIATSVNTKPALREQAQKTLALLKSYKEGGADWKQLSSTKATSLLLDTFGAYNSQLHLRQYLTAIMFYFDGACAITTFVVNTLLPANFDMTLSMYYGNQLRTVAWWQSLYGPQYKTCSLENWAGKFEEKTTYEGQTAGLVVWDTVTQFFSDVFKTDSSSIRQIQAMTQCMNGQMMENSDVPGFSPNQAPFAHGTSSAKEWYGGLSEDYLNNYAPPLMFTIPRTIHCFTNLAPDIISRAKTWLFPPKRKKKKPFGDESAVGEERAVGESVGTETSSVNSQITADSDALATWLKEPVLISGKAKKRKKQLALFYGAPKPHVLSSDTPNREFEGYYTDILLYGSKTQRYAVFVPAVPELVGYEKQYSHSTFVTDPELQYIYEVDLDHECYISLQSLDATAQAMCKKSYRFGLPNHYYAAHSHQLTLEDEERIHKAGGDIVKLRLMLTHSLNPMNTVELFNTQERRQELAIQYKGDIDAMAKHETMALLFLLFPEYTSFWLRMVHISMCKL